MSTQDYTLTRRSNGVWYMTYYTEDDGTGRERRRVSLQTASRQDADRKAEEMWDGIVAARTPTFTLYDAALQCQGIRWADSSRNRQSAWHNALSALDFFGRDAPLETITAQLIDTWVRYLKDTGLKSATINRRLAALSAILRTAHQRGQLAAMPYIQRQKEPKGRVRFLSEQEERSLVFVLSDGRGQPKPDEQAAVDIVHVLLDTGMRLGELYRVRAQDITMPRGGKPPLLHIWQTKNDAPRTVPLTTRAFHALTSADIGQRICPAISRDEFRKHWERARKELGMAEDAQYVPHMLRHTCASRLVQGGAPLVVVKEWMGHKSIETTMRYAHLAPDSLEKVLHILER